MQVPPTKSRTELHVFTDATQLAVGTVAYLRMPQSTAILAFFVMGRSKIAPIKQQSKARLELDAAVLGVRLSEFIQSSLRFSLSFVTFWTDSTTVLAWIKSDSKQKTNVSHHIKEILKKIKSQLWHHVPGASNPADHATRDIKTENIEKLWLSPPPFLLLPQKEWVFGNFPSHETNVCSSFEVLESLDFGNYSTWTKLVGVVARLYQAIQIFKDRAKTAINAAHYAKARNYLLRCSQKSPFTEQLDALLKGKPLGHKDKLLPLGPFLDDNGLIRATGRLTEAPLPWATKHPIILNSDNHIRRLISRANFHPTNALHFPIENKSSLDIFHLF